MAVLVDTFRQEMRKLGWREGKNFTIEYRFAEQKRESVPEPAAELVSQKVDLIVASEQHCISGEEPHHDHTHCDDECWGSRG